MRDVKRDWIPDTWYINMQCLSLITTPEKWHGRLRYKCTIPILASLITTNEMGIANYDTRGVKYGRTDRHLWHVGYTRLFNYKGRSHSMGVTNYATLLIIKSTIQYKCLQCVWMVTYFSKDF